MRAARFGHLRRIVLVPEKELTSETSVLRAGTRPVHMTVHGSARRGTRLSTRVGRGTLRPAKPREILEKAPALVWRSDPDGRIDYLNGSWLAFTGRPVEAQLGTGWLAGVHPDDREQRAKSFAAALAERRDCLVTYRLRRHDGAWRRIVDKSRPLFIRNGELLGYLGSCVDVTDLYSDDENRDAEREDATRARRRQDVLVREVHHRVKNNLQVILSLVALQSRRTHGPVRDGLERLAQRIRALALVQQELHDDEDVASIALLPFLGRVCAGLFRLYKAEGVLLELEGDDCGVDIALGTAVGIVMSELVSNAVLHGRVRRLRIVLACDAAGGRIVLSDDGPGIPEGEEEGLGLLLAQKIARQAGIGLKDGREAGGATVLDLPPCRS